MCADVRMYVCTGREPTQPTGVEGGSSSLAQCTHKYKMDARQGFKDLSEQTAEASVASALTTTETAVRAHIVAPTLAQAVSGNGAPAPAHTDQNVIKKRCDRDEEDDPNPKVRRLTRREEMHLKLLSTLPSMNEPLRDATGRRRSTCISSEEIVEAGLSMLVATHTTTADTAAGSPQSASSAEEGRCLNSA